MEWLVEGRDPTTSYFLSRDTSNSDNLFKWLHEGPRDDSMEVTSKDFHYAGALGLYREVGRRVGRTVAVCLGKAKKKDEMGERFARLFFSYLHYAIQHVSLSHFGFGLELPPHLTIVSFHSASAVRSSATNFGTYRQLCLFYAGLFGSSASTWKKLGCVALCCLTTESPLPSRTWASPKNSGLRSSRFSGSSSRTQFSSCKACVASSSAPRGQSLLLRRKLTKTGASIFIPCTEEPSRSGATTWKPVQTPSQNVAFAASLMNSLSAVPRCLKTGSLQTSTTLMFTSQVTCSSWIMRPWRSGCCLLSEAFIGTGSGGREPSLLHLPSDFQCLTWVGLRSSSGQCCIVAQTSWFSPPLMNYQRVLDWNILIV